MAAFMCMSHIYILTSCNMHYFCDPVLGCQHIPIDCDDGDPNTIDGCDPVTGCYHNPIPPQKKADTGAIKKK